MYVTVIVILAMVDGAYSSQDGWGNNGDGGGYELPLCVIGIGGVEHGGGSNFQGNLDSLSSPAQFSCVIDKEEQECCRLIFYYYFNLLFSRI